VKEDVTKMSRIDMWAKIEELRAAILRIAEKARMLDDPDSDCTEYELYAEIRKAAKRV
jgi:hypothetical protein